MNKPLRIKHPILKMANDMLVDLPAPSNISSWWNFGSLLGCLIIQILTGLFLAIISLVFLLITQIALLVLESAVEMIQSYVFAVLSTLYSSEVN